MLSFTKNRLDRGKIVIRGIDKYGFGKNSLGQATVEAAIMIPIVFLLILILAQPSILLYNRIVMENAAAEGCRLLSTREEQGAYSQDKYEAYIKRRLASIPPIDLFHTHTGAKTWNIELDGQSGSDYVSVKITNKLKPLPLIGLGEGFLGMLDSDGNLTQTVHSTVRGNPSWL